MTDENNPVAKLYTRLYKAIVKSRLKHWEIAEKSNKSVGMVGIQIRKIKAGKGLTTNTLAEYCELFKVK